MSRTAITLKFKMGWFPNEACCWAEKLWTDTKLAPILPDEDKNFGSSLILDFRISWRHMQAKKKYGMFISQGSIVGGIFISKHSQFIFPSLVMNIQALLDNLHEEVSCSVCMTTFSDPKQLPSSHSSCLHCLNRVLRTSGHHDIITYPECRRESRVSGNGNLKDLPTIFRINSLLDVLAIKEWNSTGVKCGNCDKRSAQSLYCFQCCAFWCDDCITAHNIIRVTKEHRVLVFKDHNIEEVLKKDQHFANRNTIKKKSWSSFARTMKLPFATPVV